MNYDSLIDELLEIIPEIKPEYKKELEWWGAEQPGPHNIFGDVLNPFIKSILKKQDEEGLLIKLFYFLEKMATCEDIMVQEVLGCTVLEYIGDDKTLLEKAKKYMGKETLKICLEIEQGLGRS